MKTIYILGRQPKLGAAEIEALYGSSITELTFEAVAVNTIDFPRPVGSAVKTAQFLKTFPRESWTSLNNKITHYLAEVLPTDAKVTLGLSVYGQKIEPKKIQAMAMALKRQRRQNNRPSLRVIPNNTSALSSAQVFHNKLTGAYKWEVLVIFTSSEVVLAKTIAVQNINAYARRDRGRPKRDARVGMLPPKLAQTMINLAASEPLGEKAKTLHLLDPFCGTGVVLQEAALMGFQVHGTDIEQRMIDYSEENLQWLKKTYHSDFKWQLAQADATNAQWHQPINCVVTEAYLGRPFTTSPSPKILQQTVAECNVIIKKFLQNLASQLKTETRLCIAVPAWFVDNQVHHLKLLDDLRNIGYNRLDFKHASYGDLIYRREGQIVGRELLVLTRR